MYIHIPSPRALSVARGSTGQKKEERRTHGRHDDGFEGALEGVAALGDDLLRPMGESDVDTDDGDLDE